MVEQTERVEALGRDGPEGDRRRAGRSAVSEEGARCVAQADGGGGEKLGHGTGYPTLTNIGVIDEERLDFGVQPHITSAYLFGPIALPSGFVLTASTFRDCLRLSAGIDRQGDRHQARDLDRRRDGQRARAGGGLVPQSVKFNLVDVFTDRPFAGNQLGVFTDARGLSAGQMQSLARELNFSESTFVFPPEQGGDARIRIFTPEQELPFAGHPTLGTAFVLALPMQLTLIRLETGSGIVPVLLEREGARIIFGRMEQPLPTVRPYERADDLIAALGVADVATSLPVELYDNGVPHVFVELASIKEVAWLEPDFTRLARFGEIGINCFAAEGAIAKTRCFVPTMGVPEDPATGSAAGPLALHLARHGRLEWGAELVISQGAEVGRPSTLYARAEGSARRGRAGRSGWLGGRRRARGVQALDLLVERLGQVRDRLLAAVGDDRDGHAALAIEVLRGPGEDRCRRRPHQQPLFAM